MEGEGADSSGLGAAPSAGAAGGGRASALEPKMKAPFTLRGATMVGVGMRNVSILADGTLRIQRPEDAVEQDGPIIDMAGFYLMPAYVDAHVHLAYYDVRSKLPEHGILAAVDLAAPLSTLETNPEPLLLELRTGPMLTAPGGYPTQGWGQNGFGWEVADVEEAEVAARQLIKSGADLLKVPFAGEPELSDAEVLAITEIAHAAGKKVAAHALSDEQAARARSLGCDILAHTPTERLAETTVLAWAEGAVISTIAAFGSGSAAIENLRRLRAAGATVLYGTDLGNLVTASLATAELSALSQAGLEGEELLATFTTTPADFFGIDVGKWFDGGTARFVVLEGDPLRDVRHLIEPVSVVSGTTVISSEE